MKNIYDDEGFFQAYAQMERSKKGLEGAGEWHQFCRFFPEMKGKKVLDLGCGYGWHCAIGGILFLYACFYPICSFYLLL